MPCFGNSNSTWSDVKTFYECWLKFCSCQNFAHVDIWDLQQAPVRWIRREWQHENIRERQKAKMEFNHQVRALALFCKKRDPRVEDYAEKKEKDTKRKQKNNI